MFLPDLLLDSINPMERIKLTAELARLAKALAEKLSPMDRIKAAKRAGEVMGLLTGSAPADELSDDPNSPNYRYKDTGYIANSRKELAQNMIFAAKRTGQRVRATDIDWNAIEENPRQAAELITKANLFGKTDWSELQETGMEPGAGFLIQKIYASIGKEPAEAPKPTGRLDSDAIEGARALEEAPLGRRDYAYGLETIRDRLENRKTVAEVVAVIDEIRDELNGVQLDSGEADAYRKLSERYHHLNAERVTLNKSSDDFYERAQEARSKIWPLERDIENRNKRGWKVDPAKGKELAEAKALAEKLWAEFAAIRENVNPKIKVMEDELHANRDQQRAILSAARRRNLRTNSATRAWLTFGERFLKLVNYRSFRGSDSFAGHITNAKSGKIKDWSWADKDQPTKVKGATASEIRFQLKVADSYQRKGGKAISANSTAELKELFGFSEVQSGNWVLKDPNSAKFHVEQTAAAMSDMADILGIDMKLLGYGGRLGMAFGARGTGGKNAARAHYEPVQRVINLTKMGGGGSLGHEWFHSMDNIIHEMVNGKVGGKGEFVTSNPSLLPPGKLRDAVTKLYSSMQTGDVRAIQLHSYTNADIKIAKLNIDREVVRGVAAVIKAAGNPEKAVIDVEAYLGGFRTSKKRRADWLRVAVAYYHEGELEEGDVKYTRRLKTGPAGSLFFAEAVRMDEGVQGKYWSQTEEMAARAFQAYLEDKLADADRRNDYLSAMADNKFYVDPLLGIEWKPYPEGEERKRLNEAFDKLFSSIREEQVFEKAVNNNALMDAIFSR